MLEPPQIVQATAQEHTPAADLWEVDVAGPESSPDPATWRTELNQPLTARSREALSSR